MKGLKGFPFIFTMLAMGSCVYVNDSAFCLPREGSYRTHTFSLYEMHTVCDRMIMFGVGVASSNWNEPEIESMSRVVNVPANTPARRAGAKITCSSHSALWAVIFEESSLL